MKMRFTKSSAARCRLRSQYVATVRAGQRAPPARRDVIADDQRAHAVERHPTGLGESEYNDEPLENIRRAPLLSFATLLDNFKNVVLNVGHDKVAPPLRIKVEARGEPMLA